MTTCIEQAEQLAWSECITAGGRCQSVSKPGSRLSACAAQPECYFAGCCRQIMILLRHDAQVDYTSALGH